MAVTDATIYQMLLEVLAAFDGSARASQLALEYIHKAAPPNALCAQEVIELINKSNSRKALCAQEVIEVIRGRAALNAYVDECQGNGYPFAF